jgi:hypothetical protein
MRPLGPHSYHFIFFVTYKWVKQAIVFVLDKYIQPIVI